LKRSFKISDPLPLLNTGIRRELFEERESESWRAGLIPGMVSFLLRNRIQRKLLLFFILLSLAGKAVAPDTPSFAISRSPAINPYASLMSAIGTFETMGNPLAFNDFENAAGIFQIRQVRVDDYNHRTGSKYTLPDMFDYEISSKVFLYFADLAGPYSFERIAKAWNGSGPRTEFYWQKIRTLLAQ
jgi:hypothetical protein